MIRLGTDPRVDGRLVTMSRTVSENASTSEGIIRA